MTSSDESVSRESVYCESAAFAQNRQLLTGANDVAPVKRKLQIGGKSVTVRCRARSVAPSKRIFSLDRKNEWNLL